MKNHFPRCYNELTSQQPYHSNSGEELGPCGRRDDDNGGGVISYLFLLSAPGAGTARSRLSLFSV